ncbi:hypothetical protein [Paenibacillus sp. FSL R7-0337]|uniref:C1q-like domain-containing protein n=1 Tax=Paenibacillus sp. FSL R7-0337 TaxID=1926588 RepID=UPI00096EA171|nr:hypothetical protein [Paenibacillus sp. FSL R7-0337]OMF88958.1 hypothetical protein BK147_26020 [Paenibacillus sp. FSL R7-0337]
MKTTGNLGLKKPDGTDIVDITDLNGNMDILDTAVKAVQDHAADTVKHITAAERTSWNAKASTAVATTTAAGLMAAGDKSKLDSVAQGANNYVHPSTHTPSIIVQDSSNRFVTDAEKTAWNGKANLSTTPQQTTADVTYYVRTDGNDGNTGLGNTAGGAFRTIGKAISMIPKVINHDVNVNVAAGSYSETLAIKGFTGKGSFNIMGTATVNILSVLGSANTIPVTLSSLTSTTSSSNCFEFSYCSWTYFNKCSALAVDNLNSAFVIYGGTAVLATCTISNKWAAILARSGSNVYVIWCSGVSNSNAYYAMESAKIGGDGNTLTGVSYTSNGSIISMGPGVINPWGDNTTSARSRCEGTANSAQAIAGSTMTKILFGRKDYDSLNEYDSSTSRFTAKVSGVYLIAVTIPLTNLPAQARTLMDLRRNGAGIWRLQDTTSSVLSEASLSGSTSMYLNAGDFIDIQVYIGGYNINTVAGGAFFVTRIA